ncbi:MAG: murC [Chitinophagaceae bacterium]|nr:murC [Chitinophagaceae bacterium]
MDHLNNISKVYFLGIGGIGMSALARWLVMEGKEVAGYDKTETPLTKQLQKEGIDINYSDSLFVIPDSYKEEGVLVVYTPAVPITAIQYQYFFAKGNNMIKRAELLGAIAQNYFTVAVSGTHGKTTTSSMVAHILKDAGQNVAAFLGGITQNYNTNVLFPDFEKGNIVFVVEADEFDRSFLHLNPDVVIVNATDPDHLDIYGTEVAFKQAFVDFIGKIRKGGTLIEKFGSDFDKQPQLQTQVTFGAPGADYYVSSSEVNAEGSIDVSVKGKGEKSFTLDMPGLHNQNNALAAFLACEAVGLSETEIKKGIASFKGVKRRFEYHVRSPKLVYIDDYAHHPEEVSNFIKGVKSVYPSKKLSVVFQPHLFSRTKDFMDGFAEALSLSDEVFLLDIYPARELPIAGITSSVLLDKITCSYKKLMSKEELVDLLMTHEVEVLATLGAGDIDQLILPIKKISEAKAGNEIS